MARQRRRNTTKKAIQIATTDGSVFALTDDGRVYEYDSPTWIELSPIDRAHTVEDGDEDEDEDEDDEDEDDE